MKMRKKIVEEKFSQFSSWSEKRGKELNNCCCTTQCYDARAWKYCDWRL
jgi:hypothetical protein